MVEVYNPARQCLGKYRFSDKARAKVEAKRREQIGQGRMNVYRCPHCAYFHLGHKPPSPGELRRRARLESESES